MRRIKQKIEVQKKIADNFSAVEESSNRRAYCYFLDT